MDKTKQMEINLPVDNVRLTGNLRMPENAKGIVIFSHGSGSGRNSPRNNFVAEVLNENRIGTFLLDLLTEQEDEIYDNRFDIPLLTQRLMKATSFLNENYNPKKLPLGYFGASTGAASALSAAAKTPTLIAAIVSRGGRPDLVLEIIPKVKSPTLLIVGEMDTDVLLLNRHVYSKLVCTKKLEIVEGATHLFEERGKLEEVSALATEWFDKFLVRKTINA